MKPNPDKKRIDLLAIARAVTARRLVRRWRPRGAEPTVPPNRK